MEEGGGEDEGGKEETSPRHGEASCRSRSSPAPLSSSRFSRSSLSVSSSLLVFSLLSFCFLSSSRFSRSSPSASSSLSFLAPLSVSSSLLVSLPLPTNSSSLLVSLAPLILLPLLSSFRHFPCGCESSRGSGRRDEGPRPRFVYRRPDDDLLSRIPSSPTRNNKYLGIRSRYLSRSTGNLSDMPRTALPSRYGSRQGRTDSGGGLARTSSETEGGGGGYTHPRRRAKDDLGHDAHVTLVEPERCPHCDGEHGAESCTTCRTYHRYFPRPSRPRAHAHAYHTNNPQAALKVLRQPGRRDLRPRKRYLAEIDGALH
ncbi:hypothetical protein C7M84_011307, partial [Penaeus vannamei]